MVISFLFRILDVASDCTATPSAYYTPGAGNVRYTIYDSEGNIITSGTGGTDYFLDIKVDNLVNIWDYATVHLEVDGTTVGIYNYPSYENTFTIFGYDVGGYDATADSKRNFNYYDGNTDLFLPIDFIAEDYRTADQRDSTSHDYIPYRLNYPYSSFCALRKPYTNEIHIFTTNNTYGGNITYYNSEADSLASGKNAVICCDTDLTIYQETTTYYIYDTPTCGQSSEIFETCASSELTIHWWELYPTITNSIGCNSCDNTQVNTLTTNTVYTWLDFTDVYTPMISLDVSTSGEQYLVAPFQFLTLTRTLYGIGTTVDDNNILQGYTIESKAIEVADYLYNVPAISGISTIAPYSTEIITVDSSYVPLYGTGKVFYSTWDSWTTPEEGDYKLQVKLEISANDGTDFNTRTKGDVVITQYDYIDVSSCHWFTYERTDCDTYVIYNKSFDTINFTLYQLNDDDEFDEVSTTEITSCGTYTLIIDEDGVYKFTAEREGYDEEITYPVVKWCDIHDCWVNYQKDLICCNPETTCADRDVYIYNTFQSQMFIFFTLLNEYNSFSSYQGMLDNNKLEVLGKINTVISRLSKYCTTCTNEVTCNSRINYSISCENNCT